jgi:hypothetical protein
VSHFFGGLISMFVFDMLQIPIGCTAPRCNPLATGVVEYREKYWRDYEENYWPKKKIKKKDLKKTAQIWSYIKI